MNVHSQYIFFSIIYDIYTVPTCMYYVSVICCCSVPRPLSGAPDQPGTPGEAGQAVQCQWGPDRRAVLSGPLRDLRPPQRRGPTEHVRTVQVLCGGNEM